LKVIDGSAKTNNLIITERLPGIDESMLVKKLTESKVVFTGKIEEVSWWKQILLG